jgi:hypothetical protein
MQSVHIILYLIFFFNLNLLFIWRADNSFCPSFVMSERERERESIASFA